MQVQLTRIIPTPGSSADSLTITVPIFYDITSNATSMVDMQARMPNVPPPTPAAQAIQTMLNRFANYNQMKQNECSIYPAIWELLSSLVVP